MDRAIGRHRRRRRIDRGHDNVVKIGDVRTLEVDVVVRITATLVNE